MWVTGERYTGKTEETHTYGQIFTAYDKSYEGSDVRLDRISSLLTGHGALLTLGDFISFNEDCHDGPVQSIWRKGSTP
jgi:hypothetical protein